MRRTTCTVLILLQLLICTIGQGALTLCVRRDGSQRLEWTWAADCHAPQASTTSACGHVHEEEPVADASSPAWNCDPCTDYLLKAEPVITVASRQNDLVDLMQALPCPLPVIKVSEANHFTLLPARPPPLPIGPSLGIVVLRC